MRAFDLASGEKKKDEAQAQADVLANRYNQDFNTEGYDRIVENSFAKATEEPLSTFSIDVDTASYANVRRFLRSGQLPPPDAVRIEELVNYFPYEYAGPTGSEPFGFDLELSPCPWNAGHSLLRVALQAKRIPAAQIPPSNLVFLIDVSGSMEDENKLPLVKESLKLLARRMRAQDRISIVVYAGSAGLVLPPTPGSNTDRIVKAIDGLESGGSTAGSEGILLAYEEARKAFIQGGSNRVILATDGDFNVGPSSDGELVRLIEEKRKAGIFLTVLGFGMGNYQDSKMQKLADSGNGNYAYVDSLSEADKVLARQMAGTLFTVAKDVKVQIEFNPALVGEYRLIGYEKRALAARDFSDDTKDAGELGAGSSVTVLYELVPPSGGAARGDLRYQSSTITTEGAKASELLTLKFRYKKPDGSASSLIEKPIVLASKDFAACSTDFRFAAAVAEWGLVLRGSAYKGTASLEGVLAIARPALGADPGGFRAEFLELVEASRKLGR
jgi:Ca-activated chloride channel family protein